MSNALTNEEFDIKLKDMFKDEYIRIGNYINNKTKIKILHNIKNCNKEFEKLPNRMFTKTNKSKCPYCSGHYKRTTEDFKQELLEQAGPDYVLIGKYKTTHENVILKHLKCNNEFKITPHNFYKGNRCPYCAKNRHFKSNTEIFSKMVYDLVKDEYKVVGEYVNSQTKIDLLHTTCNQIYSVRPDMFLNNGTRCIECTKKRLIKERLEKTEKEFIEYLNKNEDEYKFIKRSEENNEKLVVLHTKCNTIYSVRPYSFYKGNRCPYCNESKGEKSIEKWLKNAIDGGFDFERQYTFPDCKYIDLLKFDFKLEDVDEEGNLNKIILIEFDGIQHYEPINSFGGEEKFEITKIRDNIKNEYCNAHDNIDLYRIPYWDIDRIPEILTEIVRKYGEDI